MSSEPGSHGTAAHKQGRSAGENALANSFEELAAIATVRNWLVLDARRFDARARYLWARERCHTPHPQESRSRVHYMAQPGDVTGLAGMTGALMSWPWEDAPIRQRPSAGPNAAS